MISAQTKTGQNPEQTAVNEGDIKKKKGRLKNKQDKQQGGNVPVLQRLPSFTGTSQSQPVSLLNMGVGLNQSLHLHLQAL